ncbi:MAG: TonB-dependent receptor [Pseudomonadota bacterium]
MKQRASRSVAALAIATAFSLTAPLSTSFAQQADDDQSEDGDRRLAPVTVTARKKEESVLSAPLSVSAFTGEQLEAQGVVSFDQVLSTVPNAGQSGGIGGGLQGLISIRGISTLVRFVGLETGVGFYVDGVYTGRPENFNQDLIDIERIEVLRGPQGALFGKNTIAGAVNIITKTPDEFEAQAELTAGNYSLFQGRAGISGPIVEDTLFGSLSASYTSRDGYVENAGVGGDLDNADLTTYRGKLRWTPSANTEFILAADALIDRGNPAFFEVTDVAFLDDPSEATPFTVNSDQPNFLDRDVWGASLTANVDIGAGTWTTVAAHRDTSFDAGLDDDKLPVRFFVDFFGSDTSFSSLETRYAGQLNDRVDYVAGLYYFTQEADNLSNFALGDFLTGVPGVEPPIDLTSSVDTDSFAAFFNFDIALTDALSLELGGRYVEEEKDATHVQDDMTGIFGSTSFARSRTDDDFSPTVSLSYKAQAGYTLYARYAEGFKSAGFNTDFVSAGSNLEVEPEKARSFEIGFKSPLFDNRAQLNLAAFTTEYEDLQLSQIAGAGVSLNNAAEAEISGVEADLTAVIGEFWDVNASLGLLDATYDDFPGCPVPGAETGPTVANCSGNFLNLAPEVTGQLGAQFTYPVSDSLDWIGRADANYRSEVFFEPQNSDRLSGDGRTLLNLRTGIVSNKGWEIFAWANNVTDETYVNFADDRSAIFVNTTASYGTPQTYGVTLRIKR